MCILLLKEGIKTGDKKTFSLTLTRSVTSLETFTPTLSLRCYLRSWHMRSRVKGKQKRERGIKEEIYHWACGCWVPHDPEYICQPRPEHWLLPPYHSSVKKKQHKIKNSISRVDCWNSSRYIPLWHFQYETVVIEMAFRVSYSPKPKLNYNIV